MKLKKEPDSTSLIQQARQAYNKGDLMRARELALLATAETNQQEQAWLLLASMSTSRQALHYIENALRVNPESQAARKAIRLVYLKMAEDGEIASQSPTPSVKNPLDDTAPIPVVHTSSSKKSRKKGTAESKVEKPLTVVNPPARKAEPGPEEEPAAENHPGKHIRKSALRKKLQQRASAEPAAALEESSAEPEVKESPRRGSLREALKAAPEVKALPEEAPAPETSLAPEAPLVEEARPADAVEAGPQEITSQPPDTAGKEEAIPQEAPVIEPLEKAALPEQPAEETPVETPPVISAVPAPSESQPAEVPAPETIQPEPQTPQEDSLSAAALPEQPVEKISRAAAPAEKPDAVINLSAPAEKPDAGSPDRSAGRKILARNPEEPSSERTTFFDEELHAKNNKAPTNVDTIELILISVAAILLPLLVFLYFYLTK